MPKSIGLNKNEAKEQTKQRLIAEADQRRHERRIAQATAEAKFHYPIGFQEITQVGKDGYHVKLSGEKFPIFVEWLPI